MIIFDVLLQYGIWALIDILGVEEVWTVWGKSVAQIEKLLEWVNWFAKMRVDAILYESLNKSLLDSKKLSIDPINQ